MNINVLIKDALSYPFSNWKRFLILGTILFLITIVGELVDLNVIPSSIIASILPVIIISLFINWIFF